MHNGLLLSALWDAAFDSGLVSFADDGTALASPELSAAARTALGIEDALRLPDLRETHLTNLAAHRARHGSIDADLNQSRGMTRGELRNPGSGAPGAVGAPQIYRATRICYPIRYPKRDTR